MRYPVSNFKLEWNTTAGHAFGTKTSYGYHDGIDLNKNGGGDIELGAEIFCIEKGEMVYYHSGKHPTTGFGYHNVYKIVGSWGTRWIHQAHCLPDITIAPKAVLENERIARVGKSGTTYAHIHFSVFKVDPITLPNGIDTIATTEKQLNDWWEDPIKFIEKYMAPQPQPDLQVQLSQCNIDRDLNWNIASAICAELGVALDPNNKELGKQNAIKAIQVLKATQGTIAQLQLENKTLLGKINQIKGIVNG